MQTAPEGAVFADLATPCVVLVAGVGFEPTTFML